MSLSWEIIALFVFCLLTFMLAIINYLKLVRLKNHYDRLTHGVEPKHLIKALEGIQRTLSEHERAHVITKKELKAIADASRQYLQTITLKRFNPFSDTGGDQSFMLALLDGHKDGIVITSLHSRENTRFYVKSVKGGEGIEHPLSPDEQKLIKR